MNHGPMFMFTKLSFSFFVLAASGCAAGPLLAPALMTAGIARVNPMAPLATARESFVVRAEGSAPLTPETLLVQPRGVTLTGWTTSAATPAASPRPLAIRRAFLSATANLPCAQGTASKTLWLDDYRRWDRPAGLTGSRRFELAFETPRGFLRQPTALDVVLVDGAKEVCVRAPLAGANLGTTLRRQSPWASGGGLGLLITRGPWGDDGQPRLGAGFGFSGSVGAWSGLWRASLRGELLVTRAAALWQLSLPMVLEIERVVPIDERLTLGFAAGYQPGRIEDLVSLWAPQRTWSHGPRIEVMVLGGRGVADADPRQGFAARGLGLFVQHQWSFTPGSADLPPPAWIFGLEMMAL